MVAISTGNCEKESLKPDRQEETYYLTKIKALHTALNTPPFKDKSCKEVWKPLCDKDWQKRDIISDDSLTFSFLTFYPIIGSDPNVLFKISSADAENTFLSRLDDLKGGEAPADEKTAQAAMKTLLGMKPSWDDALLKTYLCKYIVIFEEIIAIEACSKRANIPFVKSYIRAQDLTTTEVNEIKNLFIAVKKALKD